MINRTSIRNLKCLREVDVVLERFTVFVGPNGSGKSSVLQALDTLCRIFREPAANVDQVLLNALTRNATGPVELAAESGGKAYRYRTRGLDGQLQYSMPNQPWGGDGPGVASGFAAADWKPWSVTESGPLPLPDSIPLRLEATILANPGHAAHGEPTMASDGSGMHWALANMALNDPDTWQHLQADLRRLIPTIGRLRHSKSVHGQPAHLLFDTVGGDGLPAHQMSEGTLLILGLLTALHSAHRPTLVLFDDLDRALHPSAQRELISLLRDTLKAPGDLQIVASTHSPYLLDCMEPNEVRMTLLRDGATVCAPLTRHPDFPKWRDEMTPGEMWSVFGEKWLAGEGSVR